MKDHRARAPAHAWSREHACRTCGSTACTTQQTACQNSSPVTRTLFLRVAALAEAAAGAAEQSRTNGAMLSESPAWALLMLARCTRSPFAPVRLPQPPIRRTRPRSSPTTCCHLMRKRSGSATTVRAECYGSSTKVVNHRFTVVPTCYELTTVLRRTLTYALGRSDRARRDLHGQLSHSSL